VYQTLLVERDPRPSESQIRWQPHESTLSFTVGATDPRILRKVVTSVFELLILTIRTLNVFAPAPLHPSN
jgi:tRNA threonylcarbamoyladenosine modification (KEOPS) complex  Pcc1 subunit